MRQSQNTRLEGQLLGWGRLSVASAATNSEKRDMGADLTEIQANGRFRRGRPNGGIILFPARAPCKEHEAEARDIGFPGQE